MAIPGGRGLTHFPNMLARPTFHQAKAQSKRHRRKTSKGDGSSLQDELVATPVCVGALITAAHVVLSSSKESSRK